MVRTLRSKAPTDEPEDPPEKGKEEPKNDPKDSLNKIKAEESKRGGSGGRDASSNTPDCHSGRLESTKQRGKEMAVDKN